ncbi:MAG TPA: DUF2127 domain-containing protein [Thermoanaerobaculia bacterium]|nr:DUF2127 domain-containing protein [Thermoanaerobaculia bacterium]
MRHSHLNPAHHYPRIFIEAASHTNDSRLRSLAVLAFLYAERDGLADQSPDRGLPRDGPIVESVQPVILSEAKDLLS